MLGQKSFDRIWTISANSTFKLNLARFGLLKTVLARVFSLFLPFCSKAQHVASLSSPPFNFHVVFLPQQSYDSE